LGAALGGLSSSESLSSRKALKSDSFFAVAGPPVVFIPICLYRSSKSASMAVFRTMLLAADLVTAFVTALAPDLDEAWGEALPALGLAALLVPPFPRSIELAEPLSFSRKALKSASFFVPPVFVPGLFEGSSKSSMAGFRTTLLAAHLVTAFAAPEPVLAEVPREPMMSSARR